MKPPNLPDHLEQCDRALAALAPFIEETDELFWLARVEALVSEAMFLMVKNSVPLAKFMELASQGYTLAAFAVTAGAKSYHDMHVKARATEGEDLQ